jgi:hypothetical protein
MIFLIILFFIIIISIEVPKLIKVRAWHEIKVYSVFMLIAFILSSMQIFGIKLPSPVKAIVFIVRDLLHINYK